jgi:hypothetical protein
MCGQIWAISLVFGEGSDSEYFGWYFWSFCQYPKEVTDIWKQVHYLLLPHSLKLIICNYIYFACVLLDMCYFDTDVTLVTYLNHKQLYASSQSQPTHTRGYLLSVTLPLKTNFNYHISAAVTDHVWRWPLCHLSIGYCCYCPSQTSNAFLLNIRGLTRGVPWRVLMDGETKWSERHVKIGVHHQWSNNIRTQLHTIFPLCCFTYVQCY